jgi:hypothetical protein
MFGLYAQIFVDIDISKRNFEYILVECDWSADVKFHKGNQIVPNKKVSS